MVHPSAMFIIVPHAKVYHDVHDTYHVTPGLCDAEYAGNTELRMTGFPTAGVACKAIF